MTLHSSTAIVTILLCYFVYVTICNHRPAMHENISIFFHILFLFAGRILAMAKLRNDADKQLKYK